MATRIIILLSVAAIAVPAWAQSGAAAEDSTPYTGTVTGTSVYVRCGAGEDYYPCTRLSSPAEVTVVGKQEQWLKILPPPGVFSAISKKYVAVDETGKIGTLIGDNVWVRAGGDLREQAERLSDFWALQRRITKGAKVQVISQGDDYYRITPPQGAYFWISALYVKATDRPPTTTAPVIRAVEPATKPVVIVRETDANIAAFRAAEIQLKAEFDKPLAQRDIEAILNMYQAIKVSDESYLKPYIQARIQFLQAAAEQIEELQAIEDLLKQAAAKQKEYELQRTKLEVEPPTRKPVMAYDAEGVLTVSEIFIGDPAAPKRFLVRDRRTDHINAYVQCISGAIDLRKYIGKHIGIFGRSQYDKDLALDVVEVEKIVVLAEAVKLPAPPKPLVKPLPPATRPAAMIQLKPTPKPEPRVESPPKVEAEPAPVPKSEPEPAPVPKPEPEPAEPAVKLPAPPKPAPKPATMPSTPAPAAEPLPPTGLPMIEPETPTDKEPVDEKQYD